MGENPFTREGSEADDYTPPGYLWKFQGYGPDGEPRYSKWLPIDRPKPGPDYATWVAVASGFALVAMMVWWIP